MMSFSQCNGEQFDKKAPATITQSFHQQWVGGLPGSNGILITIKLDIPKKKITFDSIYFNGKTVKLSSNIHENGITLTGNFVYTTKQNDIIMNADPKKEFGNTPTKARADVPFELQHGEAVISYIIKKKTRYYKLSGIKKAKPIYYQ